MVHALVQIKRAFRQFAKRSFYLHYGMVSIPVDSLPNPCFVVFLRRH